MLILQSKGAGLWYDQHSCFPLTQMHIHHFKQRLSKETIQEIIDDILSSPCFLEVLKTVLINNAVLISNPTVEII